MQEKQRINDFELWLAEDEKSANTIKSYSYAAEQFFFRFGEVTKPNMIAFKQDMMEKYSLKTASIRVIAMNKYCDFIGKRECKVKSVKLMKNYAADNVISEDEYNRLLESLLDAENIKTYWIVRFLAGTGCRVSEFVKLNRKCLDEGEATMWTKGKTRRILIPQSLIDESAEYFAANPAPPDAPLFTSNVTGSRMSNESVRQRLISAGSKCGIRRDVLHPHTFRHRFALNFLKQCNDIVLLADLMGHSDINTTALYLKMTRKEQKQKLNETVNW